MLLKVFATWIFMFQRDCERPSSSSLKISFRESQAVFLFLQVFFPVFCRFVIFKKVSGGISKENSFSSKNAPSRKSQTLRISFRESQTVFLVLQVFFRCFAGLWFSRRCLASFLRKTNFLVKMPRLENHKLWGFPLDNPKPSSYFCRCCFGVLQVCDFLEGFWRYF